MSKKSVVILIIAAIFTIAGGIVLALTIGSYIKNANANMITNNYVVEDAYNKISLDVKTINIEIVSSEDDKTRIDVVEEEKIHHTYKVENNTLIIGVEDNTTWKDHIGFHFGTMKLTLSIPNESYEELIVKISTGDITLNGTYSFKDVNIKLSTGDVIIKTNVENMLTIETSTGDQTLEDINVKKAHLEASTGKISIKNVVFSDEVSLKTTTGNKTLTNVKAPSMEIHASTGKTTLNQTVIEGNLLIDVTAGDIKFNKSDAGTIDITTSTGDVRGSLLTPKTFAIEHHTGDAKVPPTSGGLCKIKTDTGDIVITIESE